MTQYLMTVTLEDDYERRTTKRYKVEAIDHITAVTNAAAFVSDLAAISEAQVLGYNVGLETPYTDSVTAEANIAEGATFSLSIGGIAGKKGFTKVPAPINAIFNGDGSVDMADAAVTALASNFTSGFVLVSDGEVVDSFNSGRLDR